ncbi:MAG: bifunctional folylpolyglutamate synthase/dihydrofolate synthase [Desulfatibacillaceae bacterium]
MSDRYTYEQCLEELFSLGRFGIVLGLETMGGLLRAVGNPQDRFNVVHIAGSNGKGSVGATIAAALEAAGHTTGVYTSPHLARVNERFCISGRPVSDARIMESYLALKQAADLPRQPTFFEYTTAMAMDIFARGGVDWAVVETGMGGRLDATNILSPKLTVITNVSLEHREYLGNTIAEIAGEKAGIIKPGVPAVTGVEQAAAKKAVADKAGGASAPVWFRGRDFRVVRDGRGGFTYHGRGVKWRDLAVRLAGDHQYDNAAVALAGLEALAGQGVEVGDEASIRRALASVKWPGRLEVVGQSPRVVLDGAHNIAAMRKLVRHLENTAPRNKLIVVAGILDDKPYREMLKLLLPRAGKAVLCQPEIGRAIPLDVLVDTSIGLGVEATAVPKVADAVAAAIDMAGSDDTVCVCGSLYVVGEARKALQDRGWPLGDAIFEL